MRLLAIGLAILLLGVSTAGCLELHAATVPDKLLEGRGGNGWTRNATASQKEPDAQQGGLVKTQAIVYEDRTSDEKGDGFDGSFSITTIRTLLQPSEEKLRDTIKDQVRAQAESKGIKIAGSATEGTRRLANGHDSFWFTYNGTVAQTGFFTSQSAQVRVFGEVAQCPEEKTVVAMVGLAQVTDVRTLGGVPLPSDPDPETWREIVADPRGAVEGYRGSDGLAYNVAC